MNNICGHVAKKHLLSALIAGAVAICGIAEARETLFDIKDYTGRGFPPDLVQYELKVSPETVSMLHLFDATGQSLPLQVSKVNSNGIATLSFVAQVPADGELAVTLRDDSKGPAPIGSLRAERRGKNIELSNALLSVRLPGEVNESFTGPVAAATLPAPILGFRSGAGSWIGAGRILSTKPVKSLKIELVETGPVYAELFYEIQYADGGYYRANIRVIDHVPLVKIDEQYDMGTLDGTQFWELDLSAGWKPDRAKTAAHNGNGAGDPTGRDVDFAGLMAGQPAQHLVGDQAWGKLSYLGVYRQADREAAPQGFPLAGVVPLRKGLWRRSNAMEILSSGANDIRVRFPMGVRRAEWGRDITSETSPFSTQEHETGLPLTYGRRVWGLALGHPSIPDPKADRPFYQLQRLYGIVGLDRYKDFVLQWPDGKPAHPRLFDTRRQALAPEIANGLSELRQLCAYYFNSTHSSHHSTCNNYMIAAKTDAMLAHPELPNEMRAEIRARLALLAYIYDDADMMSYGNGHHHGNPNMGTARFWSGPCFMALLPDHPMFSAWRDHMASYGAYNFATQIAPGGSYVEFGAAYHMHGFARSASGVAGLQSAGATNLQQVLTDYVAPDWRYYLNLLTPYDSRWRSRMIPGMANSQPGNTENFIEASGCLARHDPALAANLAWAWQANGAKGGANKALATLALAPEEPELISQIYPGMGVIFRAHQGPQETYMLFRCGFQWSHWTIDPGHFILMSKGALLVPYQPFQYGGSSDSSFDWHNTIRFGHPENIWPHGWGDSIMLDHAFGAHADYAWALTGFPDWFITPGMAPTWANVANVTAAEARKLDPADGQIEGDVDWSRQILFMKGKSAESPNYFVIRDNMTGNGRLASYLYLNLLGTKQNIECRGGHISVDTEWPTKLDVVFAEPDSVTPAIHEQRLPIALHNANLRERVGAPGTISTNWVKKDGSPWEGAPAANQTHENHVLLRIPGAPGAGFFWVLYPRGADEPEPRISILAEGVMKVAHPEGTDYVFLGTAPVAFEGESVVFNGRAGAVRLTKDSVVLIKSAGEGKVGYKGRVVEGGAACQKSFSLAQLAAGVEDAGEQSEPAWLPAANAAELELTDRIMRGELENGIIRYRLTGSGTASFSNDEVRVEGGPAALEIAGDSVRFVADAGSYVKLSAGNRGVRGVGPFDLTFTDAGITGAVDGKTRSLVVTWPEDIVRPMFRMNGTRYFAGWSDDHSIGKGAETPQFAIGFGVTDGPHHIEILEWTYPDLPPEPARRRIALQEP